MKFIILPFCFCLVCCQSAEKSNERKPDGKYFYIETKNFGSDLQSCYGLNLNKYSDISLKLNENASSEKEIEDKHIFMHIDSLKENDQTAFEKIVITLKGDWKAGSTKYQLERFIRENGNWRRIGNLGDFTARERENDRISPGAFDVDELCEQMVELTVRASYK